MPNYTLKELTALADTYGISVNTLRNKQSQGKRAVDSIIIKKLIDDQELSLDEFLALTANRKPKTSPTPEQIALLSKILALN